MSFISDMFGHADAPQVNFTPPSFSGGGLSATFGNNGYNVAPTADRTNAVNSVASTFGQQAQDIGSLRSQFTPGASALRSSLMGALQNNRTQALGNLRDNLAQRRILGSSFAQDSLARADHEYQQGIKQIQDQTFLQELAAQQQLIQQQYAASRGQFQTHLDELNLEAGLASDLTGKASAALSSAATTQAQLDLKNREDNQGLASGLGKFLGGIALAPFTGGLSLAGAGATMGLDGLAAIH
jgi:hypothetical protein